MEFIYIGKIVNTFGIKGELKIISDFFESGKVFKKGFKLYISPLYIEEEILNVRVHKNNYLVLFKNYNDINDVLKYKDMGVYINRDDLNLNSNEYLINDLIGFKVYDNSKLIGEVIGISKNNNVLLRIKNNKEYYIPFIDEFISNVDVLNKRIDTKNGSDFII